MNQEDDNQNIPPRRSFLGRVLGMAALGISGMAAPAWAQKAPPWQYWPGPLRGDFHQMVDCYEINSGAALRFTSNFLLTSPNSSAVLIFRYHAFPLAVNHFIWKKYKIGEALKIIDPETKAPMVRNPYYEAKPGFLANPEEAIDHLISNGVTIGGCGLALRGTSRQLASNAGVTPEESLKEWTANIFPGITVLPSGSWGVNRAQKAGFTYCTGGG